MADDSQSDVLRTHAFWRFADQLLRQRTLHAGKRIGRLLEVEFYYWSETHRDPFVHQHSDQRRSHRWYLHRAGRNGSFKAGSFKGLDLTFGPIDTWGGVLLRTVRWSNGDLVEGPCLLVESLMDAIGVSSVAGLHREISGLSALDPENRLWLEEADPVDWPLHSSARVGLTLKRHSRFPSMPSWIAQRYRFTTRPSLRKGKVQTVVGAIEDGLSNEEISSLTGSRAGYIARLREAWRLGRTLSTEDAPLPTKSVRGAELARLLGRTGQLSPAAAGS